MGTRAARRWARPASRMRMSKKRIGAPVAMPTFACCRLRRLPKRFYALALDASLTEDHIGHGAHRVPCPVQRAEAHPDLGPAVHARHLPQTKDVRCGGRQRRPSRDPAHHEPNRVYVRDRAAAREPLGSRVGPGAAISARLALSCGPAAYSCRKSLLSTGTRRPFSRPSVRYSRPPMIGSPQSRSSASRSAEARRDPMRCASSASSVASDAIACRR